MTCYESESKSSDAPTFTVKQDEPGRKNYRFNGVVVDPAAGAVTINDEQRTLGSRPLEVLVYLIQNRGRVVEKQELFEHVWENSFVTDGALTQVIKEIRSVLGDDAHSPKYIRTVHRKGYQFIATPTPIEGGAKHRGWPARALLGVLAGLVIFAVLFATNDWWSGNIENDSAPIGSVAVLPFKDHSVNADEAYFAAGMTEALITELSRVGSFKVISRTSVMRYENTSKSLPEVAAELGVDAIVEGSVQRSGDQVRITAQLIEATSDNHLWTDSFDGQMADILSLQADAARSMVRGIGANLGSRPMPKTSLKPVNPAAYEAYLKAQMMQLLAQDDAQAVIRAAERVIEMDPTFAPGYAYASDLYGFLVLTTNVTDGDGYLRARQFARKAVELDPNLAYARMALARVYFQFEWNWEAAEVEFERSLDLDPNDSQALASYGMFKVLVHTDCDRGIGLLEAARNRDPFNPTMHFDLGAYNFHCRRHDESIRHLQRASEMIPSFHYPMMMIAWNHSLRGDHQLASARCDALLEEFGTRFDHWLISGCSWVYARANRADDAQSLMDSLVNPPPGSHVDPIAISWACLGLDLVDCSIEQLERAVQQRSSNMIFMQVAPGWDPLRDDPRFQSILERMEFPQKPQDR